MMEFKSKRLTYREFTADDYSKFYSIFSDSRIMEYAYMDAITDENEMHSFFSKAIANSAAPKKDIYEFAVFLDSDGSFVGYALILMHYHLSRVKDGEIGYFLLPQFWGRGYATEIAQTLTGVCFNELKLQKVVASCNANNAQSEKIMKKVGMSKEAVLRRERYKNGHWDDELRYGILPEEWEICRQADGFTSLA